MGIFWGNEVRSFLNGKKLKKKFSGKFRNNFISGEVLGSRAQV